jgi:hypothetical protein
MVDAADGVYAQFPTSRTPGIAQAPWELTSQTLQGYRVKDELETAHWVPPMVPSQDADPLAGAYNDVEVNRVPNYKSLNAAFDSGPRAGAGAITPSADVEYMVPPKFGWRTEELGIVDLMQGVFSRTSCVNDRYIDDFSGTNGGYTGNLEHNSLTIPQGL